MAEPNTPGAMAAKASSLRLVGLCTILLPTMVTAPINGFPASTVRFPFVAGLIDETSKINYIPFCTGTILTASFVLTTYGCIRRDSDKGGTYRRRDLIQATAIVVIYGTGYSPTYTQKSDRLYPNWDLNPYVTTPAYRYDAPRGKHLTFPYVSDLWMHHRMTQTKIK